MLLELEVIHWFENYLAEHKQAVLLHVSRSDYLTYLQVSMILIK